MTNIFLLLIIFQIKHFLADYPLQRPFMLKKFNKDLSFILPLFAHSLVHAAFTFLISLVFTNSTVLSFKLMMFDFIIHSLMDRIKASPNMLGRFKIEQPFFWWSLGLDQCVHHLTHYYIIYRLVI